MTGRQVSCQESVLRAAILRACRTAPAVAAAAVAGRVGCHPDTVKRHLNDRPSAGPGWRSVHPDDRAGRLAALVGDCPPRLRRRLAVDPEPLVRLQVARGIGCPAELLRRFAADPDAAVRHSAANHPRCPPQALERLAGDPNIDIRRKIACREDCPPRVVVLLADDSDVVARRASRLPAGAGAGPRSRP